MRTKKGLILPCLTISLFVLLTLTNAFSPVGLATTAYAATYYVNATNGNDSNDGLSPETAWKTISKVNSEIFFPGDSILFKRGEIWREQLIVPSSGEAGDPITFGAYGVGERPKIHNTAVINGEDWNDYDAMAGFGASFGENGDFESPDNEPGWHWFTNWNLSGGSTCTRVTDVVYHGTYAIKLHKESGGSDVWLGNNLFWGTFGSKFKLRFRGKTTASTTIDLSIRAKIDGTTYHLQSDGSWSVTSYWFNDIIGTNSDWSEVEKEFTLPSSEIGDTFNYWQVWVKLNNVGDAWVDYFRLEPKWVEKSANVYQISLYPVVKRSIIIDGERCNFVNDLESLSKDKDVYYEGGTYYVWNSVSPELDSRTFEWIKFQDATPHHGLPAIYADQKDYITFKSLNIRGGDCYSASYRGAMSLNDCDHVTINDCAITGSDSSGIYWYGNDATISNNTVTQVGCGSGIHIGSNSDTCTVSYNNIHHIGNSILDDSQDSHGIGLFGSTTDPQTIGNVIIEHNEISYSGKYSNGPMITSYNSHDVKIRYNEIHDNDDGGISIGTGCQNIDVYYNLIYNNIITEASGWYKAGVRISMSTGGPPSVTSIDNVDVFNNTIYNNDDTSGYTGGSERAGITLHCHSDFSLNDIYVKNNIVYNNYLTGGTYGCELVAVKGSTATFNNVALNNNLYYRTSNTEKMIKYLGSSYALNQFSTYQSEQGQDTDSIAQDPLFLDASNNDFRLQPFSPCINAGEDVGLTEDFDGNAISQGAAPDIGTDEYSELPPSPIPDIKVNGSDGPITLNQSDTLTVTVSLNNNGITDNADWWIAVEDPFDLWFFTLEGWTDNWQPVYQGPLFYLDSYEVFSTSTSEFTAGTNTFYFCVDTSMDSNVTWDSLYCDSVVVNVTE